MADRKEFNSFDEIVDFFVENYGEEIYNKEVKNFLNKLDNDIHNNKYSIIVKKYNIFQKALVCVLLEMIGNDKSLLDKCLKDKLIDPWPYIVLCSKLGFKDIDCTLYDGDYESKINNVLIDFTDCNDNFFNVDLNRLTLNINGDTFCDGLKSKKINIKVLDIKNKNTLIWYCFVSDADIQIDILNITANTSVDIKFGGVTSSSKINYIKVFPDVSTNESTLKYIKINLIPDIDTFDITALGDLVNTTEFFCSKTLPHIKKLVKRKNQTIKVPKQYEEILEDKIESI